MEDQSKQKQWWAPVWRGLVMDAEAKHYRKMKSALWLYLYLLVNANRTTGLLMRKTKTISRDMGVTRDTAMRWLNTLREQDYIATQSTGRYLTIRVNNWKPLAKYARTRPEMSGLSDTSRWKYPTPYLTRAAPIPDYFGPKPGVLGPPKEKKINKLLNNETRGMQHTATTVPGQKGFASIGVCARQELLAWELAKALDDPAGIRLCRSYTQEYPEELLRKALREVREIPAARGTKGRRIELFNHFLQHYAKGTTENPGG